MIQSVRSGIYLPGVCSLGSGLDSALSRTMSVSLEDKKGCRGIKSSGFRCQRRWPWGVRRRNEHASWELDGSVDTAKPAVLDAIAVEDSKSDGRFYDLPGPDRAMGSRFSTGPTISPTSFPRPKQASVGARWFSKRGTYYANVRPWTLKTRNR